MLSIREDQFAELRRRSRREFLEKLETHLCMRFSKQLASVGSRGFRDFVEATVDRAEAQGMSSKDQIRRFAEVVVVAREGLETRPEHTMFKQILDDSSSGPRQKLTALENWLLFEQGK